jgi:hypothetical protein
MEIYNTFYSQNSEVGSDKVISNGNRLQLEDIHISKVIPPPYVLNHPQPQLSLRYEPQN